jgi:peptidoglycan/xylan/chitin deacetylase (PgdA/CDA1 family)
MNIIVFIENLVCSVLYFSGFIWLYNKFSQHSKKNHILILVYHHVQNYKLFFKQIEYLRAKYELIDLNKAIELLRSDKDFTQKFVITFDDGYKNTYYLAKKNTKKIPVFIYLSTYYIESGEIFWWDIFRMMAKNNKKLAKSLSTVEEILKNIQQEERDSKIEELIQYYNQNIKSENFEAEASPLSWNDLKEMKNYDVDFGGHGHHHYVLTNARLDTIKEELKINKELIEKNLSVECNHFAYPGGYYNKKIIKNLKEHGYLSAATIKYGINTKNTDLFELYRIGISDYDWIPTVAVKISGLWAIAFSIEKIGKKRKKLVL